VIRAFIKDMRATMRYWTSGPADGEARVIGVLAERIEELLAAESFQVSTDGRTITVSGTGELSGRANVFMPVFIWRLPMPATQRLDMLFESASRRLQEFLTAAYGKPWPSSGAEAHVSVRDDVISVWWGGEAEEDAVERLRPIDRSEVGL
jgi:hypothetical protein